MKGGSGQATHGIIHHRSGLGWDWDWGGHLSSGPGSGGGQAIRFNTIRYMAFIYSYSICATIHQDFCSRSFMGEEIYLSTSFVKESKIINYYPNEKLKKKYGILHALTRSLTYSSTNYYQLFFLSFFAILNQSINQSHFHIKVTYLFTTCHVVNVVNIMISK